MMKTFVNGLKAQYKLFIKDKINESVDNFV